MRVSAYDLCTPNMAIVNESMA